jgi:hypothetical protein
MEHRPEFASHEFNPSPPAPHPQGNRGAVELHPLEDLAIYLKEYARERPEVVALTCLGLGFILGWKLKPW